MKLLGLEAERKFTDEETNELIMKAQKGDLEAETQIIKNNTPFVFMTIKGYMRTASEDWCDVFMAAIAGMRIAIQRFDPDRGFKFMTYARHEINHQVRNEVRGDFVMKLPKTSYPPTQAWQEELKKGRRNIDDGYQVMQTTETMPYEELAKNEDREELRRIIQTRLSKRHARIFNLRHPRNGKVRSYKSVGEIMNMSAERVRQIIRDESKTLRKVCVDHGIRL